METSLVLAKIMGPIFFVLALHILLYKKEFLSLLEEFVSRQSEFFLFRFQALILGMLIVTFHNVWVSDWPVVITFMGWCILLKGVVYMLWPSVTMRVIRGAIKSGGLFPMSALFTLLVGGYLSYFAYFA